jgi:hypothetical protein
MIINLSNPAILFLFCLFTAFSFICGIIFRYFTSEVAEHDAAGHPAGIVIIPIVIWAFLFIYSLITMIVKAINS